MYLAPAVFPTNAQFASHFKEFILGYRPTESVECKFPHCGATRVIEEGSVGVVDGFLKILTMIGVCAILHFLVSWQTRH